MTYFRHARTRPPGNCEQDGNQLCDLYIVASRTFHHPASVNVRLDHARRDHNYAVNIVIQNNMYYSLKYIESESTISRSLSTRSLNFGLLCGSADQHCPIISHLRMETHNYNVLVVKTAKVQHTGISSTV